MNHFVLFVGTESETKAFMAVCIETAKRYNLDDYRTPVFIFERLCSIIYPVSFTILLLNTLFGKHKVTIALFF